MTGAVNTVEEVAPGIMLVRYAVITAEASEVLLAPLVKASQSGPMVLLATVPPGTNLIPAGVVPFWLNAMLLKGVRVRAIGVATTSRAVKVVLSGFQAAMKLRANPIAAVTLATEAEVVAWAKDYVAKNSERA